MDRPTARREGDQSVEQVTERATKPWDDLLAVQPIADGDGLHLPACAMDRGFPLLWIDDPQQAHATAQVFGSLGRHRRSLIPGREHLDREVGGEVGKTSPASIRGRASRTRRPLVREASFESDRGFRLLSPDGFM